MHIWESTLAYRRYLWSLGFGLAEAMDTAQRGMGLDWPTSLALIQNTLDAAKEFPNALVASGCGTDHLDPDQVKSLDDVIHAYEYQMEAIEALGGKLIIMASRALVKVAKGPDDYEKVYARIISQAKQPVILHWLGDMFDPALNGYWGYQDLDKATQTALDIIHTYRNKVDGIKVSLMVGGQQSARSVQHLCDLFVLADKAGLFLNPELAHARMQSYLKIHT